MMNENPPPEDDDLIAMFWPGPPAHVIIGHGIVVPRELAPEMRIRKQSGQEKA